MEANNMKAMREALVGLIDGICFHCDLSEDCKGAPCEKMQKAKAALAAPPRNCDVGTAEEQFQRMADEYCNRQKECYELPSGKSCPLYKPGKDCRLLWAQMPYESEAGK